MTCEMPPVGWTCSREAGHDGPCAASPVYEPQVELELSEAFALYHYVMGDGFDGEAIERAINKIQPLYYESLDSEE